MMLRRKRQAGEGTFEGYDYILEDSDGDFGDGLSVVPDSIKIPRKLRDPYDAYGSEPMGGFGFPREEIDDNFDAEYNTAIARAALDGTLLFPAKDSHELPID